jgi:formylglycine-generating enzyme
MHVVTLTRSVYWDEHEVTQGQFDAFVGSTSYVTAAEKDGSGWIVDADGHPSEKRGAKWTDPSPDGGQPSGAAQHPVVLVSWDDAKAFAAWAGVRLPSEAEFERLLRRGGGSRFPWGDAGPPANAGNFADAAGKKHFPTWLVVEGYDDGFERTAPVKSFPPDAFGLYDLSGNVAEWCEDGYDPAWYGKSPTSDPVGPIDSKLRVARGGSWFSTEASLRCSARAAIPPTYRSADLGFRCCVTIR